MFQKQFFPERSDAIFSSLGLSRLVVSDPGRFWNGNFPCPQPWVSRRYLRHSSRKDPPAERRGRTGGHSDGVQTSLGSDAVVSSASFLSAANFDAASPQHGERADRDGFGAALL
jgi:hypothetical protein